LTSEAFIVVPGGIGTVLETLMVWQLLQVGHLKDVPLILLGKMWDGLLDWSAEAMLSNNPPLADARDMKLPVCLHTIEDVITQIEASRAAWLAR
jgi:predicted Rossmann-fold nucleotide-binding protein